mgnify:CR=1 FL=1
MATLKKRPSRSWPNFHNGDDLRKKKQDAKRDGLSPKYGESREPPANKTWPKKPSSKKLSSKKSK